MSFYVLPPLSRTFPLNIGLLAREKYTQICGAALNYCTCNFCYHFTNLLITNFIMISLLVYNFVILARNYYSMLYFVDFDVGVISITSNAICLKDI